MANSDYLLKKKHFENRFGVLKTMRAPYEPNWREINVYFGVGTGSWDAPVSTPRAKDPFYGKNINTLPTRYAQNLAASLVATLTPSNMRWFGYTVSDETREERIYLRWCSEQILALFNRSGLNSYLYSSFLEAALYGVNPLGIDWSTREKRYAFFPMTIGQFWIGRNDEFVVNQLYHRFGMTVREIADRFGEDKLTSQMKLDLSMDRTENVYTVVHAIEENPRYLPAFDNGYNKRYISAYYIDDANAEGFLEWKTTAKFPWNVSTWGIDPETPYCPGIGYYALGDVKSLQTFEEDLAVASAKMINPPVKGSTSLKTKEKDIGAGGITYTDDPAAFTPLFQVQYDINTALQNIQRILERLYELFYNNVFYALMNKSKTMSATEAAGINTEKMTLLGAVVERLQSTLLGPLLENAFLLAWENGALEDETHKMPDSLRGKTLEVTYHSLMAQTQSLTDLRLVDDWLQRISILAAINPNAARKPDIMGLAEYYAKKYDIDLSFVVSDEVIAEQDRAAAAAAEEERAAQQAAMNIQNIEGMASAAKDFAVANEKNPNVQEILGV